MWGDPLAGSAGVSFRQWFSEGGGEEKAVSGERQPDPPKKAKKRRFLRNQAAE